MKRVISPTIFLTAQMFASSELGMMVIAERTSRCRKQAEKPQDQRARTAS